RDSESVSSAPSRWASRPRPLRPRSLTRASDATARQFEIYNVFPIGTLLNLTKVLMTVDAKGVDGLPNGSARLTQILSRVSSWFDTYVVDLLVNLQGWIVRGSSVIFRSVQTGFVQNYALMMVAGLLVLFVVFLWPWK